MILYVMWDGSVNQMGYSPSGDIVEDFWWSIEEHGLNYVWEQLDYSVGSDPNFKNHEKPIRG